MIAVGTKSCSVRRYNHFAIPNIRDGILPEIQASRKIEIENPISHPVPATGCHCAPGGELDKSNLADSKRPARKRYRCLRNKEAGRALPGLEPPAETREWQCVPS